MEIDKDFISDLSLSQVLNLQMKTLWNLTSVGVMIFDSDGNCQYMNQSHQDREGISFDEAKGKHVTDLYRPHTLDYIPTAECLRKGKPILHLRYAYKTNKNTIHTTITDFFPLFVKGKKDGVITFTIWEDNDLKKLSDNARSLVASTYQSLYAFDDLVGNDPIFKEVIEEAKKASLHDASVMIWGESGTGKEIFAQSIHSASSRRHKPFIPVNCAAIPENLLEAILFGSTKGIFTDARDKAGLFEDANGGTLVLDELNSMPLALQSKLLRALQEKRIRRLGSHKEFKIDVRIISILNQSPLEAIEKGILRRDLYFRLATIGLNVPPLRKRIEDIPLLGKVILQKLSARKKINAILTHSLIEILKNYEWPGNVRELEHVLEGCLVLSDSSHIIGPDSLPKQFKEALRDKTSKVSFNSVPVPDETYFDYKDVHSHDNIPLSKVMAEYESRCINNVLRITGGNVAKAARILGLSAPNLHYKIKALKIPGDRY